MEIPLNLTVKIMRHFAIALIYIAFFALIGSACYFTQSGWPIWGLLLMPSYKSKSDE